MRKKVKIIFLDVDGVLNNNETYLRRKKEYDMDRAGYIKKLQDKNFREDEDIDRNLIRELNKIIEATDAKIVISSCWRIGRTVERLQDILTRNGCVGEVIDKTGRSDDGIRGNEIQRWLDEHKEYYVENFVILDDSADMEHLYPFLIRHNFKLGLTPKLRDIAIRRLKYNTLKCPIERGLYPGTIAFKTYTAKYEADIVSISQVDPITYWHELTTIQRVSILKDIQDKGDWVWKIPYRFSEEMY